MDYGLSAIDFDGDFAPASAVLKVFARNLVRLQKLGGAFLRGLLIDHSILSIACGGSYSLLRHQLALNYHYSSNRDY